MPPALLTVFEALIWAHTEPQYAPIKACTIGVIFFATPHRGSGKADYGMVLTNVATAVMNKPKSKLINALQSNSDTLMALTSEFRFQTSNYQIVTFYEMKPMSIFSSLVSTSAGACLASY